jgi:hypothetical protein
MISNTEHARMARESKELLFELRTPHGDKAVTCIKLREELGPGDHGDEIYRPLV